MPNRTIEHFPDRNRLNPALNFNHTILIMQRIEACGSDFFIVFFKTARTTKLWTYQVVLPLQDSQESGSLFFWEVLTLKMTMFWTRIAEECVIRSL